MHTLRKFARLVFIAVALAGSGHVFAAINEARYIVYFDSANKLIGAQYINCQNITRHAGVIDTSDPYRMEMHYGCGKPILLGCDTGAGGNTFCTYSHDYSNSIFYFRSATGYTAADYCLGHYNLATEFVGRDDCSFPAPQETNILQPWVNGWGS